MPRPKSPVRPEWVDASVCSPDHRLKIIGRVPFLRHLDPEAILEISRLFEDGDVTTGQAIYFEGDLADYLYIVAVGKVKLMCNTNLGREVLLDILQAGEYFGNLSSLHKKSYTETAIAQTDGCILQISAENFEVVLAKHPDVTLKLLSEVSKRLTESQELIKQLSSFSLDQRIASALIRLADKLGERRSKGVLIQLPFSRQDLAAMTGTTVESVSRLMSQFSAQGIITTGRKWVSINDLDALAQIVKEHAVN